MSVIEKELERCAGLKGAVTDEDLIFALEERIDIIQMAKESIEGDIGGGLLTPQGYCKKVQGYVKHEMANLNAAK